MRLRPIPYREGSKLFLPTSLFALTLLYCRSAGAEHGSPGYRFVFAENVPPPTNTLIPLAGGNGVPFSLQSLKKGHIRAVEQDGNHVVPLDIAAGYDDMEGHAVPFPDDGGGYGENLILLSPRTTLHAGKTYTVEVDLTPEDKESEPYVLHELTVGSAPDKEAPLWRNAPFLRLPVEQKSNNEYQNEHASLTPTIVTAIDGLGQQPSFVIIDLSPLDKQARPKRMIATLLPKDPTAGEHPCGRVAVYDHEFNVYADDTDRDLGRRYHARLTAVDMAGNRTKAPGSGVDIVWNTWMSICNEPEEKERALTELPAPRWTGVPEHALEADSHISGIARYDDTSPFFERIRIPIETKTSLFVELAASPIGREIKPLRFIAKISPPDIGKNRDNEDKDANCEYAMITNDDRERLRIDPETEWNIRITLTDIFGRRLVRQDAPLRVRLGRVRMSVCPESGESSVGINPTATVLPLSAAPSNSLFAAPATPSSRMTSVPQDAPSNGAGRPALKWRSFPVLRPQGLPQSVLGSDLLLVDLDAGGPVYLLIKAYDLKLNERGPAYKFFAMLDPRGAPAADPKHGCAIVVTDPEYRVAFDKDDEMWSRFRKLDAVRLEITAMDSSGQKVAAPSSVIWNSPEQRLAVCIPDLVVPGLIALSHAARDIERKNRIDRIDFGIDRCGLADI